MILDRIENLHVYAGVHPLVAPAVEFFARADLSAMPLGRHAIDGERFFVIRDLATGKGKAGTDSDFRKTGTDSDFGRLKSVSVPDFPRLEAHRKYIDIQISLDRPDVIGYKPASQCRQVSAPYDAACDIEFFADAPDSWLALPPGSFAMFFPTDAHAPLAIDGQVNKAVLKLAVD